MKIKNILCVFSAFLVVLGLTGCVGSKNVEGTLEEIMEKVYADVPEDQRPMMLGNIEVTNENVGMYLGTENIEFEEALARNRKSVV